MCESVCIFSYNLQDELQVFTGVFQIPPDPPKTTNVFHWACLLDQLSQSPSFHHYLRLKNLKAFLLNTAGTH